MSDEEDNNDIDVARRSENYSVNKNLRVMKYKSDSSISDREVYIDSLNGSIWCSRRQIADLFDVDVSSIAKHIKNIFGDGELNENSNVQKMHSAMSSKPLLVYSVDMVISIGYRVNSRLATRFRQWATQTLKTYLEQGYVINERVLRDSPEKLNKLAAQIRALRNEEKQVFSKVRECFKISSSDYDKNSDIVRKFYQLLQDKFHHAITGMTSSKIILDRANYAEENMGLKNMSGKNPTLKDAQTGKNYLNENELYRLHILSEQFLLYAESTALSEKKMTMASLHQKLDDLLRFNEYPVLDGYRDFLREEADEHARRELKYYKMRIKIESSGMEFIEEDYDNGEYDHLLENLN